MGFFHLLGKKSTKKRSDNDDEEEGNYDYKVNDNESSSSDYYSRCLWDLEDAPTRTPSCHTSISRLATSEEVISDVQELDTDLERSGTSSHHRLPPSPPPQQYIPHPTSSSSTTTPVVASTIQTTTHTATKLLQVVQENPTCAICLDVFASEDSIIFCSNTIQPHCFHQDCSLEYFCSHSDGVQAPCPLCRQPLLLLLDDDDDDGDCCQSSSSTTSTST